MVRGRAGAATPDATIGEAGQINLFWLINLRWAAALGQLLTILYVAIPLAIELPLGWLFAVLTVEVASNAWLERWFRLRREAGWRGATRSVARISIAIMLGDTLLLTALLWLTGGVANPFCAFVFVHVVLGAVILRPRWAYAGALFACACLGALYWWHRPLPALAERPRMVLQGLVVAIGMVALITVFFVSRVTRALERRNAELSVERERQARTERLEALGTLAAGAAHELATPLSTIAVVARELERRLELEGASDDDVADARLVRDEVARCRRILDRMTVESGDSAGEALVACTVRELLDETLSEVVERARVDLELFAPLAEERVWIPVQALAMALRSVLSNALDASPAGERVRLTAARLGEVLEIEVEDRGEGMDAERARRATDPFFTTKEPGRGMGLGLFLTRSVVDRLGGELLLDSRPGVGTRARVRLPFSRLTRT